MKPQLIVDGHHLDAFTTWGDLDWSLCWTGHSDELTFDVTSHPRVARTGALAMLTFGGIPVWSGPLEEPVRGEKLRAKGLFRMGDDFTALDGMGDLSIDPDVAVPAAIARGLPWQFGLGFGVVPPLDADKPTTISALLTAQAVQLPGYGWGILPNGRDRRAPHAPPRLHVTTGGGTLGIARDNYASTLIARYLDSTTSTYKTAIRVDAAAARRWGQREVTLPALLNDGAAMTLTEAQTILESMLAAGRARPGWTSAIEVEYGAILNNHQQPVLLESIPPYATVRVHGLDEDVTDLAGQTWVDMPVARIDHRSSRPGAITLTPVGLVDPMGDVLQGKSAA